MAKTKSYQIRAFAAIHETAAGIYDAGVMDKKTMRRFDNACLTPIQYLTAVE